MAQGEATGHFFKFQTNKTKFLNKQKGDTCNLNLILLVEHKFTLKFFRLLDAKTRNKGED